MGVTQEPGSGQTKLWNGAAGRARVEAEFTIARLRERLRAFYEEMAALPKWPAAC